MVQHACCCGFAGSRCNCLLPLFAGLLTFHTLKARHQASSTAHQASSMAAQQATQQSRPYKLTPLKVNANVCSTLLPEQCTRLADVF